MAVSVGGAESVSIGMVRSNQMSFCPVASLGTKRVFDEKDVWVVKNTRPYRCMSRKSVMLCGAQFVRIR